MFPQPIFYGRSYFVSLMLLTKVWEENVNTIQKVMQSVRWNQLNRVLCQVKEDESSIYSMYILFFRSSQSVLIKRLLHIMIMIILWGHNL